MTSQLKTLSRLDVAKLLKTSNADILKEWESQSRVKVAAAKVQSHLALRDSLPEFLDQLVLTLECDSPKEQASHCAEADLLSQKCFPSTICPKEGPMPEQCHIKVYKEKILNRWERISREMFPAATDKSRTAIRNHLPQLIDALCEVIETGVFENPKELGKIHGRQRFSFGDYTLSQVLDEYWLLKKVVFDELEHADKVVLTDFRLINRFFESAASVAAVEFAKLREIELKKAARHLEASYQDLERFSAVAAHDLRSPASTIIGYADLVLDDAEAVSEDIINQIKTIKNVGSRMIHLIDQLLEYAKIGKSKVERKTFSLSVAAQEARSNLAKDIAEAGAVVSIESLPEVLGHPILFTQLFQNLIANSLKFKSEKRIPQITISSWQETDLIKLRIKDNGIGFDPSMNQEIFEPFKRGDNSKNIVGSGLGLATVQKIVDLHDGKVSAVGRVDEGAEFNIEIPQATE